MLLTTAGAFRQLSVLTRLRAQPASFFTTSISSLFLAALIAGMPAAAKAQTATTTTLALSSGDSATTSVALGSVVTLTATVAAGATPVTVGQVNFCDASTTLCADIHLFGTAQLTSTGTAVFKCRPGVGSHSFKAVFLGTPHGATAYAGSASSTAGLTVTTALIPTAATLVKDSTKGDTTAPYPLMVTVGGTGSTAPSGTVSFVDLSGATVVGTATLGAGRSQLSLLNSLNPVAFPPVLAQSMTTGDFNGDGIPDVAVTGGGTGVLLGDGNGGFTLKSLSTTVGGYAIAAADFNGDGKLDLAVSEGGSSTGTVSTFLGNGDGTFAIVAANSTVGLSPVSMAAGDFNGDGLPDLAVVQTNNKTVAILLGNGDGTFTASPASPVTDIQPQSIVSGDLNGDGIPDLVVVNYGSTADNVSGSLTVLLGNGDGTFLQPATNIYLDQNVHATSVAAGDFNGDGNLDLAVKSDASGGYIFLGDGHSGFRAPTLFSGGYTSKSLVVGDFNQDGIADLADTDTGSGTVTVIPGNGDGTFSASPTTGTITTTGDLETIAAADFNGDGYPDLISASDSDFSVFITATQIATASASSLNLPPGQGQALIVAHYAGDSNDGPSTSLRIALPEQLYVPVETVTPSSSSITSSQALTVAITVAGEAGYPTPTGTVTLHSVTNGDVDYTSAAWTLSGGAQSITIPAGALANGINTLFADYSPDTASASIYGAVEGSAGVTVGQPVFTLSATTVNIAAPGAGGSSTVTVTPTAGFTGSVALACTLKTGPVGATEAPSCPAASPVTITGTSAVTAILTLNTQPFTSPGAYVFTVTGTSGSLTETTYVGVQVATPGTSMPTLIETPSAAAITSEQSDTVMVTVTGSGTLVPAGAIRLIGGGFSGEQTLVSGTTSFNIPAGTLSAGGNVLVATYSGDGTYALATGTTTVTVVPVVMSITVPPSIAPGASATTTATLNAGSTYSGTMNLTCALTTSPSGAQSLPTCSLNPASVTLAAGASATATLTVKTTAASSGALIRPPGLSPWKIGGGAALAGLLLLGIPLRRRRWLAMLALLSLAVACMDIGCGGGGSTSTPPVTTQATTAGNYVFKVTGVDATNANVTVSANATVTVQ